MTELKERQGSGANSDKVRVGAEAREVFAKVLKSGILGVFLEL